MSDDEHRLTRFGLMADRRYNDRPPGQLVEAERRVRAHERANPGHTVITFEDWRTATGYTDEARFVRWEAVRADTDAYLHWFKTGNR